MFNAENASALSIIQAVQQALTQYRAAMDIAQHLRDFQAGVSLADLTAAPPAGPGMSTATAQSILDSCADAWGHAQLYQSGTDPRNPAANYVYGASIKLVLGPTFR